MYNLFIDIAPETDVLPHYNHFADAGYNCSTENCKGTRWHHISRYGYEYTKKGEILFFVNIWFDSFLCILGGGVLLFGCKGEGICFNEESFTSGDQSYFCLKISCSICHLSRCFRYLCCMLGIRYQDYLGHKDSSMSLLSSNWLIIS